MDLLRKMMENIPQIRPSAEEALQHEFFKKPNNIKIQDVGMTENFMNFQAEFFFC